MKMQVSLFETALELADFECCRKCCLEKVSMSHSELFRFFFNLGILTINIFASAVPRAGNIEQSVQEQGEDEDTVKDTEPLCDCEDKIKEQELFDPLGVTGIEEITLEDFPNCESTRLVPDEQMMLGKVNRTLDMLELKKSFWFIMT